MRFYSYWLAVPGKYEQFFYSGAYPNEKQKGKIFPAFSTRVAVAIFFVAFFPLEVPSATPPPRAL